jgi:methionine-rich copper-binding protein CopC
MRKAMMFNAAALSLLIAGQACAHARLLSAVPKVGSTVASPQTLCCTIPRPSRRPSPV